MPTAPLPNRSDTAQVPAVVAALAVARPFARDLVHGAHEEPGEVEEVDAVVQQGVGPAGLEPEPSMEPGGRAELPGTDQVRAVR